MAHSEVNHNQPHRPGDTQMKTTRRDRQLARQSRLYSNIITGGLLGLGLACGLCVALAGNPILGIFIMALNVSTMTASL
jgi:hypothetical protein